ITLIVWGFNFLAIILVLYAFSQQKLDLGRRLRTGGAAEPAEPAEPDEPNAMSQAVQKLEKVMRPIGEMIVRSPEEMSRQEKKLGQAGFRRKDAVALFYSAQLATAVLLALVFLASGYFYRHPVLALLLCFLG